MRVPPPVPARRHIPAIKRRNDNSSTSSAPVDTSHLIVNGTALQRGISRNQVIPFFSGNVTVSDWSASPSGHTVRLRMNASSPVHPFYGLVGNGAKGQRILLEARHGERIIYDDQALVTWRGDDSINGQTVSIRLDTTTGEHPFAIIRSDHDNGNGKGDPVSVSAWIVDDDEHLISKRIPFQDMSPVRQAILRGKDANFIQWTIDNVAYLTSLCGARSIPLPETGGTREEICAIIIRTFCGISSRKELDLDTRTGFDARMKWTLLLSLFDARKTDGLRRYDRHIMRPGT